MGGEKNEKEVKNMRLFKKDNINDYVIPKEKLKEMI